MTNSEIQQQRVRDYFEIAQTDISLFLASFSHPFFVLSRGAAYGEVDEDEDSQEGSDYFTKPVTHSEIKRLKAVAEGLALDPDSLVYPVVKRKGANPYSEMVTVGRANNCDIILHDKGVSKFHFYLQAEINTPSQFTLGDGGSRNGTRVNDKLLAPKQLVQLASGDDISLGPSIFLRFYLAKEFCLICRDSASLFKGVKR